MLSFRSARPRRHSRRHSWGVAPSQFESCRIEQRAIFTNGPLASAQHDEHVQVDPLAEEWLLPLREHQFYHQELSVRWYRPAAMSQDCNAAFVVPIVQDLRQQIGIAARRNLNKEIAADDRAAIRHTSRREMLRGGSGHVRLIEQDPSR